MVSSQFFSNETVKGNKSSRFFEVNENRRTSLYSRTPHQMDSSLAMEKLSPVHFNKMKSMLIYETPFEDFNNHLKNFIRNLTTHLVDEVCLYSEKVAYLEQCYKEIGSNEFRSKEEMEIKLKAEKDHISIRSIENENPKEDVKYHKIIPVFLRNESNNDSGKYGWFLFLFLNKYFHRKIWLVLGVSFAEKLQMLIAKAQKCRFALLNAKLLICKI